MWAGNLTTFVLGLGLYMAASGMSQAYKQQGAEEWVAQHLTPSEQSFIGSLSRPDVSSGMGNMSCCNDTDCHQTEEDMADGHYRARIGKLIDREWVLLDWVDIPDAKVIKTPPKEGSHPGFAILCETNSKASYNSATLLWTTIFCFLPGVKM